MEKASLPLIRIMPTPPIPVGVARAAIVSFCIVNCSILPFSIRRWLSTPSTPATPLRDAPGVGVDVHCGVTQEADQGDPAGVC